MSITYPLSMPFSPSSREIRLRAHSTTAFTRSRFTGQRQVTQHQGERWEAEIDLPPMVRAAAEEWLAFLLSLRGQYGTFLLGDPGAVAARGTGATVTINGAGQTGRAIALSGTGTILKGDYLQVGTGTTQRLYKALIDATLPATVDIFPIIRESPTNGASVTMASAKGVFMLAEPNIEWDLDTAKHYGISFKAVEAF